MVGLRPLVSALLLPLPGTSERVLKSFVAQTPGAAGLCMLQGKGLRRGGGRVIRARGPPTVS